MQQRCIGCLHDEALIARWASKHYPDSYAGMYVEGRASDRFRVGFTHHQGARIRSIKELPGLVTPGRVHRFPYVPRYSMEELVGLEQMAVDDLLLGDAHPGVAISVGLIVQRNIVSVGSEHVKRARKLLSKLYGRGVPIEARYERPPVEVSERQAGSTSSAAVFGRPGSLKETQWAISKVGARSVQISAFVLYCGKPHVEPYIEQIFRRRGSGRIVLTMMVRYPPTRGVCVGEL